MMNLLGLSLIGGALALDTTAVLQSLISQPIIAGSFLGWLSNDLVAGLKMGFILQLLWLSELPVGAARVPEGNLGSMIGILLMFQLKTFQTEYFYVLILIGVFYALFFSAVGQGTTTLLRRWNVHILDRAMRGIEAGQTSIISKMNLAALLIHWVVYSMLILGSVIIGVYIFRPLLNIIPASWNNVARLVETAVLGCGAGFSFTLFNEKKLTWWVVAGIVAGIILYWFI